MTEFMVLEARPMIQSEVGDHFVYNDQEYFVRDGSRDRQHNHFRVVSPVAKPDLKFEFQVSGLPFIQRKDIKRMSAERKMEFMANVLTGRESEFEDTPKYPLVKGPLDLYRPRFATNSRIMSRREAKERGIVLPDLKGEEAVPADV